MSSTQNIDYASIISKSGQNQFISRPSIFDIIAQENMHSLFRLSFNHLLKWVSVHSKILRKIKKYSDEVYLVLHSIIEFFYLKAFDSLFSEHFYGLKRSGLNSKKRVLSILTSIVAPYLKAKLDNVYEELEKNVDLPNETNPSNTKLTSVTNFIKKFLLKYYPYFHLLWSSIFWFYRFRYIINSSDCNSPLLSLIGTKLIYNLNRNDNEKKSGFLKISLLFFNNLLTNVLYFIQFLKWHQDYRDNQTYTDEVDVFTIPIKKIFNQENNEDEDLIPPPKLPEKISQNKFFKNLNNQSLCPLCTKKRTNECVLSVSGFVFCYPCIFKFIKSHNRCPLTNYPCTTKDIIRIYSSE